MSKIELKNDPLVQLTCQTMINTQSDYAKCTTTNDKVYVNFENSNEKNKFCTKLSDYLHENISIVDPLHACANKNNETNKYD